MSHTYILVAQAREQAGKGVARSLRREGKSPAVVYGANKAPVKISLDDNKLNVTYNKGHMFTNICELDLDGKTEKVLARDIQLHPVTDRVEHVDFLRVTAKTKLAVMVPIHFIDEEECPGLQRQGVLNVTRHEVEVVCKAMDIPEAINVSLKGIEFGQAVKWSHAVVDGVEPVITDRDFTIATMLAPKVGDDDEDEAGDEAVAEEGEEEAAAE